MLRTIAIYYSTVHLMWCVFIIRDSKDTRDSLFSAYTVAILNRGHLYSVVYVIEIDKVTYSSCIGGRGLLLILHVV